MYTAVFFFLQGGGGFEGLITMLPPLIILLLLYQFMIVRPQRARQKSHDEMLQNLKNGDKIIILEDTNQDGRADKCTVYLDDLNCPTGFQFFKDGILLMQAPDLLFVRDTDGDGKADWKERVLMGLDSADSHHTANSLIYEPGGAILLSDGVFHGTKGFMGVGAVGKTAEADVGP